MTRDPKVSAKELVRLGLLRVVEQNPRMYADEVIALLKSDPAFHDSVEQLSNEEQLELVAIARHRTGASARKGGSAFDAGELQYDAPRGRKRGDESEAAPPLLLHTATEVLEKELEPVDWVIPELLATGCTLLIAKPKVGKTYMIIDFGFAVATGGKALGQVSCDQGDALLLLLEDNLARYQRRLKQRVDGGQMPPDAGAALRVAFAESVRRINTGLCDQIREWHSAAKNPRLAVIDTLTAVRPLGIDKRGVFQAEYELCKTINDLAHELKIGIVLVHHMRKATSEDILDQVSGSLGLNAAVDAVIGLQRVTGGFELKGRGRDVEEFDCGLVRGDGRWRKVGSAEELRITGVRRVIYNALKEVGEPMTPTEIVKATRENADTVKKTLGRMLKDGEVEKVGHGKYRVTPAKA